MSLHPPDLHDGEAAALAARTAARAAGDGLAEIAYALVDAPRRPARRRRHAARPPADRLRARERRPGRRARRRSPRACRRASSRRPGAWTACGASSTSTSRAAAVDFDVALDWGLVGSGFARRVLQAAIAIPFGSTSTYREVAGAAGSPQRLSRGRQRAGRQPDPDRRALPPRAGEHGRPRRLHRRPGPQAPAARHRGGGRRGAATTVWRMTAPIDPNDHDVFLLRQRIKLVINQYEFFLPSADGKPGEPLCFVEQKRFKFKEDIRFYTDESKTQELLRIKARQAFDPRATYDVTDDLGATIGAIQKVFGQSLLRSTYRILDAQGEEVAITTEKSLPIALFRRAVGFVPVHRERRRLAADPLPLRLQERRADHRPQHAPDVQDPRQLHDRHEPRQRPHPRPPPRARDRRRHGCAAGPLGLCP